MGTGGAREDAERPLSAAGREGAARVAATLQEMGIAFDRIGSSPLMRAVQTAEITAAGTGFQGPIESCPFLARAGGWRTELPRLLEDWQGAPSGRSGSVALVGHNPDLGDLVTELLDLPSGSFPFEPGGVILLEMLDAATLRWWLDPRELRLHREI